MAAAEPAQDVTDLIDAAVLPEHVLRAEIEEPADANRRQLRGDYPREVRAEVRELRVVEHEYLRIDAIRAEPQFVEQRLAECVGILHGPVRDGQGAAVGSVRGDIAVLREELRR